MVMGGLCGNATYSSQSSTTTDEDGKQACKPVACPGAPPIHGAEYTYSRVCRPPPFSCSHNTQDDVATAQPPLHNVNIIEPIGNRSNGRPTKNNLTKKAASNRWSTPCQFSLAPRFLRNDSIRNQQMSGQLVTRVSFALPLSFV